MIDRLVFYVGDRNPSITENITIDGTAVDLSSSTVTFSMRKVGASTALIDAAAATVTDAAAGAVRYDWSAGNATSIATDMGDSPSVDYLVWWEVTTAGKIQSVSEALIEWRAHAPDSTVYVEVESFKATTNMAGTNFADGDIRDVLEVASRAVDNYCVSIGVGAPFYQSATQTRYFTAGRYDEHINIGPVVSVSSVTVDADNTGTWETTWVEGTDFVLDPANATVDGLPYRQLTLVSRAGRRFPDSQRAVKVTGVFGWPSVPPQVKQATRILANRLIVRTRQAPLGVIVAEDVASSARLGRVDPDVAFLLQQLPGRSAYGAPLLG